MFHGSLLASIPCLFSAILSLKWFNRIVDQLISTPAAVKSTSHQNTVNAPLLKLMKLRNMKMQNSNTQTYGVPQDVVRRKIFGAWPFSARPYNTLVPDSNAWFDEDQAEVMTTALTTEGMAGIPAAEAAMTKGL